MTSERRRVIAVVVFVARRCWSAALGRTGRLSRCSTSCPALAAAGLPASAPVVLDALFTVVPPFVTIVLARVSGSRLARYWRNAHLAVLLAMVIVPLRASLRVLMVSIVVFLPVQVFFVVGALAIWIASPRQRPHTPAEASS